MQDAAELSMHHQFTGQRQRIIALVTMLAACLVSLTIDLPVARWMKQEHLTGRMQRLIAEGLEVSEAFGHGFGATLVILGVAVLDPLRRKTIPWLVAGSLGAGMAANSLKYLLPRIRPRDFDLSAGTFWDTFSKSEHTGWGMQSFPSAHTATAVGLAVMLAHCYPRGRWYFTLLASLVGLQRMAVSAHFPSDVLAGAAVGWVVGHLCAVGAQPSRVPAPGE